MANNATTITSDVAVETRIRKGRQAAYRATATRPWLTEDVMQATVLALLEQPSITSEAILWVAARRAAYDTVTAMACPLTISCGARKGLGKVTREANRLMAAGMSERAAITAACTDTDGQDGITLASWDAIADPARAMATMHTPHTPDHADEVCDAVGSATGVHRIIASLTESDPEAAQLVTLALHHIELDDRLPTERENAAALGCGREHARTVWRRATAALREVL